MWKTVLSLTVSLMAAIAIFTFAASIVFVLGTGHWRMYPHPTIEFWRYLPYARHSALWSRWLSYGAIVGGLCAAPVPALTIWDMWLRDKLRGWRPRSLYGETAPATRPEMQDAGLSLTRKL